MTPKQQFQTDKGRIQNHLDSLQSGYVERNLLIAFNELCWSELPSSTTPERAIWSNAMREGAQKLIATFLALGDQQQQRKPNTTGQLTDPDASYRQRHSRPSGSGPA